MGITLNLTYEIIILVLGLAGFVWLATRRFELAIYLTITLLPLYLLKVKIFFVPSNVLEILIGSLFGIWLLRGKVKDINLAKIREFAMPALVILIGAVLATLLSENLKVSAGILKSWFVAPMIFALIITTEIKTKQQVKKTLWALSISAGLVSLVALFYFLQGKLTYDGRLSSFFLSSNHLAMYLAPGFLVTLALFGQAVTKKEKIILLVGLATCGIALYLTFSYAAWISVFLVVIFYLVVTQKERSKKLSILYFLFLILFLAALFFSQLGSTKLQDLSQSSRSSWQSRLMIWQAAWQILKDNSVFGIGPGMFQEYYLKYQDHFAIPYLEWAVPQPHNLLLAFWLQSGLTGLIGFVWLLGIFFKKIFVELKNKNQSALILFLLMGYTLLHGLADTTYWKNDLAVIFWVVIALSISVSKVSSDPPHSN